MGVTYIKFEKIPEAFTFIKLMKLATIFGNISTPPPKKKTGNIKQAYSRQWGSSNKNGTLHLPSKLALVSNRQF